MTEIKAKKVLFKNRDGEHLIPYVGDTAIENRITNCLLEVPQNIKLELNDGVITLKAGSVATVPNGFEADGVTPKFDEVEIKSDISTSYDITGTHTRLLCYRQDTNSFDCLAAHCSGDTLTVTSGNVFWYDTVNNLVKVCNNGVVLTERKESFPIAVVTAGDGKMFNKIDQIFNGMGYIGNTLWVDKGVKVLIPDGRNSDGSLKSIEATLDKVCTVTDTRTVENGVFVITPNSFTTGVAYNVTASGYTYSEEEAATARWYKPSVNMFYLKRDGVWTEDRQVHIGITSKSAEQFTLFKPKQPFRAVDYNDITGLKAYIVETYVNGTSWYRVWSDGWIEQGGYAKLASSAKTGSVTLLKTFSNTNYTVIANDAYVSTSGTSAACSIGIVVRSSSKFDLTSTNAGTGIQWRACGY